jgi:hypothetical protein
MAAAAQIAKIWIMDEEISEGQTIDSEFGGNGDLIIDREENTIQQKIDGTWTAIV